MNAPIPLSRFTNDRMEMVDKYPSFCNLRAGEPQGMAPTLGGLPSSPARLSPSHPWDNLPNNTLCKLPSLPHSPHGIYCEQLADKQRALKPCFRSASGGPKLSQASAQDLAARK